MRLRYSSDIPDGEGVLLTNGGGWRVEIYVLANNDPTWTLVALSGASEAGPQTCPRQKLQGPYESRDQAMAARSAIALALIDQGFTLNAVDFLRWRIDAQRCVRDVRVAREQHAPDCRFDPKDVL